MMAPLSRCVPVLQRFESARGRRCWLAGSWSGEGQGAERERGGGATSAPMSTTAHTRERIKHCAYWSACQLTRVCCVEMICALVVGKKGNQGRPLACPELHHLLFQWFVDYRKVVKGRLWPRTVLKEAIRIKEKLKQWYRDNAKVLPLMPPLDLGKRGKRWLRRWKKSHDITFKKCARKFKVSNDKLRRRTKTTWLNSWSAMLIFNLLFGEERAKKGKSRWPYQHTRDQKGIMINEAESKSQPTLATIGKYIDTGIKTDYGQSRDRLSLWTEVSNDPAYDPPLELCFKVKTDRTLKDLVVPPDVTMTLEHSKSGSYNYPTSMRYLNRHIPVWTAERAEDHDYRILFLDDYRVHNMKEVFDFCWERGWFKIKIGGGCTFILCNCDLDLHADIERDAQELDTDWAAAQLTERPWRVPKKDRQTIVDDWTCIWRRFPHARRGIDSFKLSGLAARPPERIFHADGSWEVPLIGPDDWMINRDARNYFSYEQDMPAIRKKRLTKIYEAWDAGEIQEWSDVLKFHDEHSDSEHGGEHDEGEELLSEKPLSDGSTTDLDEEYPEVVTTDLHDDMIVAADVGADSLVPHQSKQGKELRYYQEMIERAKNFTNPRIANMLKNQKKAFERSLRGADMDAIQALEEENMHAVYTCG